MFQAGQQIGFYKLIEKIGKGGFGEVWLAEKRSEFVTRRVAVKLPHGGMVDFDEIRKEATLWEQANGHPNVLPLIDADVFDGQVAIVSEYADGGSLADKLKELGKFPVRESIETTIGVLNGLEYLHSQQIIHRDIKPANILLRNGVPLLADFGISRALQTSTTTSVVVGTENYMAPEAFEGARNIQTDIWSVGVVLYQLLKGSLPFPQKRASEVMYAVLLKEPEPLPADIPLELRKIVFKALEKDKELDGKPPQRYQTAAEMRDDLEHFLETFSQSETIADTAPVLTHAQAEVPTRVKLKIPIPAADAWRSFRDFFTSRKISPLAIAASVLFLAGVAWLSVYLFTQAFRAISSVSLTNSNISNSAEEIQTSNADQSADLNSNQAASNANAADSLRAAQEYSDQGYKFYTQKKYDQAIEAYTKGIEISPQDAVLYNDRGLIFLLKGDLDRAIDDLNKSLELDPASSATYNNRGLVFAGKGDRKQAIADYRKALELDPNNKKAEENLKGILK
jgi:serine/threonine protein kinase